MRVLHTADWHLADRLGRIDRTHDLRRAVERVGDYCRQESVDVLLVAGDLFSELARPDGLRETIEHWQHVFRDFLAGGGTILTLTGNHDNENFCRTLTHAMNLAAPTPGALGARVPPGLLERAFIMPPPPRLGRFLEGHYVICNLISNPLIDLGILFELALCYLFFYTPLSQIYYFAPMPCHVYLFAFHGTILLIVFEEVKKYYRRKGYSLEFLG